MRGDGFVEASACVTTLPPHQCLAEAWKRPSPFLGGKGVCLESVFSMPQPAQMEGPQC